MSKHILRQFHDMFWKMNIEWYRRILKDIEMYFPNQSRHHLLAGLSHKNQVFDDLCHSHSPSNMGNTQGLRHCGSPIPSDLGLQVGDRRINKPFVEKPVDRRDRDIYAPRSRKSCELLGAVSPACWKWWGVIHNHTPIIDITWVKWEMPRYKPYTGLINDLLRFD